MAAYVPTKRVTAPLDDDARARLCGEFTPTSSFSSTTTSSSGSEHDGSSPCLSTLIHAFLENPSPTTTTCAADEEDTAMKNPSPTISPSTILNLLNPPTSHDPFRSGLLADVSNLVTTLGPHPRPVMTALRAAGYNAGLCKSRWPASGSLTAGTHDYIDVLTPASRYIVDLHFAAEFEIARPTEEYQQLVAALPRVAVAAPEEVGRAVKAVAEAAERSMRRQGLLMPPWRKKRYMVAKWLGPYRRTVNALPAAGAGGVTCRFVGFHTGRGPPAVLSSDLLYQNSRVPVYPATGRECLHSIGRECLHSTPKNNL